MRKKIRFGTFGTLVCGRRKRIRFYGLRPKLGVAMGVAYPLWMRIPLTRLAAPKVGVAADVAYPFCNIPILEADVAYRCECHLPILSVVFYHTM